MTVDGTGSLWPVGQDAGLLHIPPFPRAQPVCALASVREVPQRSADEADALLNQIVQHEVGGAFWRAALPSDLTDVIILRPSTAAQMQAMHEAYGVDAAEVRLWAPGESSGLTSSTAPIYGEKDPWSLTSSGATLCCDVHDPLALWAVMHKVPVRLFDSAGVTVEPAAVKSFWASYLKHVAFADPFDGGPLTDGAAIHLLSSWRKLIVSNRNIVQAHGFAFWKRDTVEAMLWNGENAVPFATQADAVNSPDTDQVAIWLSRTPAPVLEALKASAAKLVEVEDGFIRSKGLGADCVPPLSIIVDDEGIYFDPSQSSNLETIIRTMEPDAALLQRAAALRAHIVAEGVSKYAASAKVVARPADQKRVILVTGQVEDDRSVLSGGGAIRTNLELLQQVRAIEPDSYILYRSHPDIEAGHRKGRIEVANMLAYADAVAPDGPISGLLDMVDALHVWTSLAGFEALMRGKEVITHGVPFYAGWGLTRDLAPMPARRQGIVRSLDELVAATLLLYPRYIDPVTGLPCEAELVVRRMAAGVSRQNAVVTGLRRFQGQIMRLVSRLRSAS